MRYTGGQLSDGCKLAALAVSVCSSFFSVISRYTTTTDFGAPLAERVATLADGQHEAGSYTLRWDGRDEAGRELASGMYLFRLVAGERMTTRKLLLLR